MLAVFCLFKIEKAVTEITALTIINYFRTLINHFQQQH
nr:MAG TPA: hypothetical protein [Caudoviricetes sp.]